MTAGADTHRLPVAEFEQICAGAVPGTILATLEMSQYSQRKLALRALFEQLEGNPETPVSPEDTWRILAGAERRDPCAVREILLYHTVGVWLTRALHHTRPDSSGATPWAELGYLQLIVAAAAVRSQLPSVIQVPVWHGVVSLPTVGRLRLPTSFPIGTAELRVSENGMGLRACGGQVSIDFQPGVPSSTFAPAKQHVCENRGLTLVARIEDVDPYREFGAPQPPAELDQPDLAEWHKMLDEAWDVLTLGHPGLAQELSAGLRALVPIRRDAGIVGASSAAAFGGIVLSPTSSAIELAETLAHELQHSKLNALLDLVNLTADNGESRFYAPWRDDPRPLTGLLHGLYAFTCVVEFMLVQRESGEEPDVRNIDFTFAHRRHQLRQAINLLGDTEALTEHGRRLVAVIDQRLASCEQPTVSPELADLADLITADHQAIWRLRFVRPDPAAVESVCGAWLDGAAAPSPPTGSDRVVDDGSRTLPAHRRNLLRTKALEPELFARRVRRPAALSGATPQADAALCLGDHGGAALGYRDRIRSHPHDLEAWVGLGLGMRAQGRAGSAAALLESPELTVAAHHRVRTISGSAPDPIEFADWIGNAL